MAFIAHEDELWPVVLVVASGYYSIKQHVASLKQWNKWLAKQQTFYVIQVFLDTESLQFCDDISKSTNRWMQYGAKQKIEQNVAAMTVVVPKSYAETRSSSTKRKVKIECNKNSIHETFVVLGDEFVSIDAAYEHLQKIPSFNDNTRGSNVTLCEVKNSINGCITKHSRIRRTPIV